MKEYFFSVDIEERYNDPLFKTKFRLKQIVDFVFKSRVFDFQDMTTLPLQMRSNLEQRFFINTLVIEKMLVSKDGTVKCLFKLQDGSFIESVLLRDINNRKTFCISSQVGCRMGCRFCKTGEMGLIRNLTAEEIVSQLLHLYKIQIDNKNDEQQMNSDLERFNIVLMGMGEPLDNIDELSSALTIITDKRIFGLSQDRITLSTCGVADRLMDFFKTFPGINLAVSLNSNISAKRSTIMPINNKYPLEILIKKLDEYYRLFKNRVTLEFVLIRDFNTGRDEVEGFIKNFKTDRVHINLIPLNHNDELFRMPVIGEVNYILNELEKAGFNVTRRYRRGDDINADCGQLYANIVKEQQKEQLDRSAIDCSIINNI